MTYETWHPLLILIFAGAPGTGFPPDQVLETVKAQFVISQASQFEMEIAMLKRYALIGGMIGMALALSAFAPARYARIANISASPALSEGETNFRIPHMWNGYYIPSMSMTGLLRNPITFVVNKLAINFRQAHMWQGTRIPSRDVTGLLALPMQPLALQQPLSNFRLPHMWNKQYIPSMSATGSLSARQWNSGH
jgi:hypothetical protein